MTAVTGAELAKMIADLDAYISRRAAELAPAAAAPAVKLAEERAQAAEARAGELQADLTRQHDLVRELRRRVDVSGRSLERWQQVTGVRAPEHVAGAADPRVRQLAEREMLAQAARLVITEPGKALPSALQRKLRVGYAKAVVLLDQLEAAGVVGPARGVPGREVLVLDSCLGETLGRLRSACHVTGLPCGNRQRLPVTAPP